MGIGVLLAVALVLGLTGPVVAAMRGKEERIERLPKVAVKTIPLTLMLYVATTLIDANNAQSFEASRPHPLAALAAVIAATMITRWSYKSKPDWAKFFAGAGLMATVGIIMTVLNAWGYAAQNHYQWLTGVSLMAVGLTIVGIYFWVTEERVEKE